MADVPDEPQPVHVSATILIDRPEDIASAVARSPLSSRIYIALGVHGSDGTLALSPAAARKLLAVIADEYADPDFAGEIRYVLGVS